MHLDRFFLETVEAKVNIIIIYVQPTEKMAINKFQRSRLTLDLSAKVGHIGVPSVYQNIIFSETVRPIELKLHMKTPYNKVAKSYTNYFGHMTMVADIPIYGKAPFSTELEGR